MPVKRKKIVIASLITVSALAILYYFFTHYPVGTFKYVKQNDQDLDIEIKITENLDGFIDIDYNMDVKIGFNGKYYTKYYSTSGDEVTFQLLNNKGKKYILIFDNLKDYCKCEDGSCGDFFSTLETSYMHPENGKDTLYFTNYADSIKGDTLSSILFTNLRFMKMK
ncbi:hypothetical protein [Ferruginibacter sp. SUN106]|uniref:hypothetical protein n=1 Tax=Ferruginibacter sp. SUN106 TaxID=2978348 RepID=UPI003D36EC1E